MVRKTITLSKTFVFSKMKLLSSEAIRLYLFLKWEHKQSKYRHSIIGFDGRRKTGILMSERELCYEVDLMDKDRGKFFLKNLRDCIKELEQLRLIHVVPIPGYENQSIYRVLE